MIVLDASAVVDLLLDTPPFAEQVADHLRAHDDQAHAPHLVDVEVGQTLRRYVLQREITSVRATRALSRLAELPITRYPHLPLLEPAFRLRTNLTVYDAIYVVLARALEAPFLTKDRPLARAARRHTEVVVLEELS